MNGPHNADAAQPSLRVLIVDDSPEDASRVVQELAHSQFQVSWERVESEADYLQQLQTVPGLILADCTLSHFSAARALQLLQRTGMSIPLIVVSGVTGEDTAVTLMKQRPDFATLQKLQAQNNSTSSSPSNNPIAQAFSQLSTDLQSGNLSAAQQDYTTIQQAFQSQATQSQATQGRHHHHSSGGSEASEISQLLDQLGTALQSGDLSAAQSTFTTLQQEFQQLKQNSAQTSSQSNSSSTSVTA